MAHRLILEFDDKSSMLDFASVVLGRDLAVYRADSLDREVKRINKKNTYIVRRLGEKPKSMLA